MTTVELAARLARHLKVKDLALLPADGRMDLVTAMNAGLAAFYQLAPGVYKSTEFAGTLRAARTVTLTVTKGSATFGDFTPLPEERGCTIRVDGDPRDNEITAANGLLDVCMAESGTRTARIWGDVLHLDAVITRLTNDPCLENSFPLLKADAYRRWGGFGWASAAAWQFRRGWRRQVGHPRCYWIENVGQSQGGVPPFYLRVDALPDRDYRVRVSGELAPRRIEFGDLLTPAPLPVADQHAELMLLPLCLGELVFSPLWENTANVSGIQQKAAQAREAVTLLYAEIGKPDSRIYTPKGW